MSQSSEITALTQELQRTFLAQPLTSLTQPDPDLIRRLSEARQRLNPPRGHRALPRITQGILAFRLQGQRTPYPDLKYACHGIARQTDWEGRLLINNPQHVEDLLAAVSALVRQHPYAYRACALALLTAWQTDIADLQAAGELAADIQARLTHFLQRAGLI